MLGIEPVGAEGTRSVKVLEANGARIPALGLGTWQLRGHECREMVRDALDHGYRHVDTAVMYENEEAVGEGLLASSVPRDDIFLTTKVWPDDAGAGDLQRTLEGSLRRLGTDAVDLVLIHWPSKTIPFAETAGALDDVVSRGLARHVGVSNFTVRQVEEAVRLSRRPLVCNQIEHHPRIDQAPVRRAAGAAGMAVVGYCPLFRAGDLFDEPAIRDAAAAHGKSAAQIVLRWHMQQDNCGAIPKTATPPRMRENFDIFDFELSGAELKAIDALSAHHDRICDHAFSPDWDPPTARAA